MAQVTHLAVVGTQWGDEGKGKIVDYLSKPKKVAAIARYQDSPELRAKMAANAKAFAERTFSLDTMMEGFMEIYDEVVSGER